jgi:hypothetical protein
MQLQQTVQLSGRLNQGIGAPMNRWCVISAKSVSSRDRAHACRTAGLDIAQVIADVHAILGPNTRELRCVQQRRRMRLGMRGGITADGAD